jgi:hypothetical protein
MVKMPKDFEQIRREVVEAGGIKWYKMQTLRDASPYKKLGPGVNQEISAALHQKSLDHSELPLYQTETVYVFEQGSDAVRLIHAVAGTPTEDGAKAILKAVTPDANSKSAEVKLDEVKALVVQLEDVFKKDV